jgi:hypothetical protein
LKNEFKKAAKVLDSEEEEGVIDESDKDSFIKKKSADNSEDDEQNDNAELNQDNLEKVDLKTILKNTEKKQKKKKEMALVTDKELLKRFYGDESQLDDTDKFLRNYILLECWKDKKAKEGIKSTL